MHADLATVNFMHRELVHSQAFPLRLFKIRTDFIQLNTEYLGKCTMLFDIHGRFSLVIV